MLSDPELKSWLQKDLSRAEKVLLVLASSDDALGLVTIKLKARLAGCSMDKWSIPTILQRAKGTTLKVPLGYELSEKGFAHLQQLGVGKMSPAASKVATDLRQHLSKIKNPGTRAFVGEAISCFEADLFRSAIVMSWLAAMSVLHNAVLANKLNEFNAAQKMVDHKWKAAITADDLGLMKESDFLNRLVTISMIGKNAKAQLVTALDLRNGCGHPNSLKVGANVTAAHLEVLLLNVFDKFPD